MLLTGIFLKVSGNLTYGGNSTVGGNTYITQGNTEGGDFTFTGMSPNCEYQVSCTVYRTDTGASITSIQSQNFTTTSSGSGGGGTGGGESGGGDETTWTRFENSFGVLNTSATVSDSFYIGQMNAYVYSVTFSSSGYASFYTTGSVNTKGYLTDSIVFVNTIGEPIGTSIIAENNQSDYYTEGDNFRIRQYVRAGDLYYIWVRCVTNTQSGFVTLKIDPPPSDIWTLVDYTLGTINANGEYSTSSISMNRSYIYRYSVTFAKNGIASFYDSQNKENVPSGNTLLSYISTSTQWDKTTGGVTEYIMCATNGMWLKNRKVKAGETYYLWAREESPACNGRVSAVLSIEFIADDDSIPKWDWYSSNGDNTIAASQTISAYNAINGTGTGRNTKNFSHLVWDDMVDKVKAICDEAVGWWDSASYGLSYANTKAIVNANGEYVLTSNMFNSLRNNLEIAGYQKLGLSKIPTGISSGTIPHPVNSGDTVYGHYFITLTDYMNSCIDKL